MKRLLIPFLMFLSLAARGQIQDINVGSGPDAGDSETARSGFIKVNNNFDYHDERIDSAREHILNMQDTLRWVTDTLPEQRLDINTAANSLAAHIASGTNPHLVTASQIGLGSVENTALSLWAGTTNITTLGTIGTGTWQGTVISPTYGGTGLTSIATLLNSNTTASDVGLGNVENTALSTWAGSANITTLGTIGTGTWQGTTIGAAYGGTGLTSIATLLNSNTTASDVGLGNVENTALSTWAGSTSLTTLGTIATGTWQGTAIADAYIPNTITLNNITQITARSHTNLSDIGSLTHAQLDTHVGSTSNPHSVTASQVGAEPALGNPGADGYVLSSTAAGVRSWIPNTGGGGTVTSVAAGNGMNFTTFTTSGSVTLGTPSSITTSSTNSLTSNSHTHALDLTGYTGGTGITTLGTIGTGVWQGTDIASGYIADALTGKTYNGVNLTTGGTATYYLDQTGNYSIPAGGGGGSATSVSYDTINEYTTDHGVLIDGLLLGNYQLQFWGSNNYIGATSYQSMDFYVNNEQAVNIGTSLVNFRRSLATYTDKTYDLGSLSYFWRYGYIDRLYIDNANTYIDVSGSEISFTDATNGTQALSDLIGGGSSIPIDPDSITIITIGTQNFAVMWDGSDTIPFYTPAANRADISALLQIYQDSLDAMRADQFPRQVMTFGLGVGKAADVNAFAVGDTCDMGGWYNNTGDTVEVVAFHGVVAGSSPDIDVALYFDTNYDDGTPTMVETSSWTVTSTTTGNSYTTGFENPYIPPGAWCYMHPTEVTAAPTKFRGTVTYIRR